MTRKVLIIADGNSSHTVKWVKSFYTDSDIEVSLFSLSSVNRAAYIDCDNLEIVDAGWNQGSVFLKIIDFWNAIFKLRAFHKKLNPDIVHGHYATSSGLLAFFINPTKLFLSVWGSEVYFFPKQSVFHKVMLKIIFMRANTLFSTSADMAKEANLYTDKKIHVIPFGVDIHYFKNDTTKNKNDHFTIGTVKRLGKVYGIDLLIRAFSELVKTQPDRSLKLLIVGDGSEFENLVSLAKELDIYESTTFQGDISYNEVVHFHNQIDIAVYPSHSESFGVSVIESSACEVPVITSDVGGLPEVVVDGETGFIVERNNVLAITEKLNFLINNEARREEMGQKGREFVENKYSWPSCFDKMKQFYLLD
jgi:glycosyltransferase involved in cell wall biosynthesis